MKARELCFIAVIASIEAVVFTSFSFILYLECITFTIVVFAMTFQTRQAVLGAVVFTILNLSTQGVAPWSMMYCLIYPLYIHLRLSVISDRPAGTAALYADFGKNNSDICSYGIKDLFDPGLYVHGALCHLL